FVAEVEQWLRTILPPAAIDTRVLPAEVEAFVSLWLAFATSAELSADDRRTGDALARMVGEVVKCDEPSTGPLRAAFDWFARKADAFTDAAVRAGGTAMGVGVAAYASGQLPHLLKAIETVRELL